ncbi:MAG: phosphatase PAP2 family protein [Anaerolineales bacterium]|nr:phosphatase PAP2 family protein [Anaerolineales bacterium]
MDSFIQWEVNLVQALQSLPGLQGVMTAFSFLGNEEFFLFVMPLLYWCLSPAVGARAAVLLIASNGLSNLLKVTFAWPRPYWMTEQVAAFDVETSYGQPSSHTLNATVMWGYLASAARRPWAWPAAIAVIVLIALSRVYLGMHFPSNLVGGWLFGGLLLGAFWRWGEGLAARLARLGLGAQLALALAVSLAYLGLGAVLLALVPAPADLPLWAQTALAQTGEAITPRAPDSLVSTAGMVLGLGAGLALVRRHARFDAGGPLLQRALRFLLGVAGVAVLFLGLRAILPGGADWLAQAGRYVRYALIVFWALYLAPLAFLKLRLAEPARA